jgi:DNA uptake protein ComE-like DNA-binding protein
MFQKNIRFFGFLIAFAMIANMGHAQGTASGGKDAPAAKKATPGASAENKTKKADLVDINAASKDELTALLESAMRIARRSLMVHPYTTKRDLLTKKILPQHMIR